MTAYTICGRLQTPMKSFAMMSGIPVVDWPPDLVDGHYDVGVVVSFGHLIPNRIIEKFPL